MLHGKWYRGVDDLSPLNRQLTQRDLLLWHLHITNDGETFGYCALEPGPKEWSVLELEYTSSKALDLIMRQVKRKMQEFKVTAAKAQYNERLQDFGFFATGRQTMEADPIILPEYCKG